MNILEIFGYAFIIEICVIVIAMITSLVKGFIERSVKISNMKTLIMFERTLSELKQKNYSESDIDNLDIPGVPKTSELDTKIREFLKEEAKRKDQDD